MNSSQPDTAWDIVRTELRRVLTRAPLRIVRCDDPRPALELVRSNGAGWFLVPLPPRARLRLRYRDWPQPHLRLEDTPRPGCRTCGGSGEVETGGDEDGPYEPAACHCWEPWPYRDPVLTVPVPRWAARRWCGWAEPEYSSEPPF
ncbi:hypothetical protein [Kitasatospora sp. NPDC091276]|uniref:hypothetical protein n=1 Tax=unclassified Kitasatospora TaxID=2633591 RepID=UPI003435849F